MSVSDTVAPVKSSPSAMSRPGKETSQELQMLSSVTINCQLTKIVMNPCSQLSVLQSVSQMSQVSMIAPLGCSLIEVYR